MKRIIAAFGLFAMSTIGLVTRVSAQEQTIRANVPFNFTVGNRQLPSGTYRIVHYGTSRVLIESTIQGVSTTALGNTSFRNRSNWSGGGQTKLIFDKVGGQYFLKEIVSTSIALAFPVSQSEKRAKMLQGSLNSDAKSVIPTAEVSPSSL